MCTSSGISAGMDMTPGFVADLLGYETADDEIDNDWKENPSWDTFLELY